MDRRIDPRASALRGVALPERYVPIRRIASGGMASVWCAHDQTLDRDVAIKLLAEPYAHDEVAGRRFKREARAAARLSGHPNVVTIYDVSQTPPSDYDPVGRPFIVMEHLPAGTVADALAVGAVRRETAVRWLQQAASALDYAHRCGVIHRDVKLANFLLDGERVLHVADFGIAQLGTEDGLTSQGHVVGTAGYLAPERALGHPATEASDRYALAVAAFELLVGERPFTAAHVTTLARQHVEEPRPLASRRNPELPRALDPVLARGMAQRPEERFATSREFASAVDEALSHGAGVRPFSPWRATPQAPAPRGRPARPLASPPVTPARGRLTRGLSNGGAARGRTAALAALAVTALGVGIAAGVNSGSSAPASGSLRAHGRTYGAPLSLRAAVPTIPPLVAPTATTQAPTSQANPAPAPPPTPPGPDALESQGHQLMAGGDYTAAIPVLRQAVATAAPSSLIYAYALYDLGRSLRLAGNPRAAVSILYRRLQIPNQTDTVRAELTLALRALGQEATGGAPQAPGAPQVPGQDHHGHDHHGGAAGPAADTQGV